MPIHLIDIADVVDSFADEKACHILMAEVQLVLLFRKKVMQI